MHYGIRHSDNAQTHNVPEEILAILHFIRYGILSVRTRIQFIKWIDMDSKPTKAQERDIDPVTPDWIIKYIINPVEYLVHEVIFGKFNLTTRQYGIQSSLQHATEAKKKENYTRTRRRMIESVKHNLFADIIEVLLRFGPCPALPRHVLARFEAKHRYTICREQQRVALATGVKPGIIEVILSHLPFIFENSFEKAHSQICQTFPKHITSTGWDLEQYSNENHEVCRLFRLWVPMPTVNGAATIPSFIDMVMNGYMHFHLDSNNKFSKYEKGNDTKKGKKKSTTKKDKTSDTEDDEETTKQGSTPKKSSKGEKIHQIVEHIEHLWTKTHLDETPQKEELLKSLKTIRETLKGVVSKTDKELMVQNDNPRNSK